MGKPESWAKLTDGWSRSELYGGNTYSVREKWFQCHESPNTRFRKPDAVFSSIDDVPPAVACYAIVNKATGEVLRVGRSFSVQNRLSYYFTKAGPLDRTMRKIQSGLIGIECEFWVWYTRSIHMLERRIYEKFKPPLNFLPVKVEYRHYA